MFFPTPITFCPHGNQRTSWNVNQIMSLFCSNPPMASHVTHRKSTALIPAYKFLYVPDASTLSDSICYHLPFLLTYSAPAILASMLFLEHSNLFQPNVPFEIALSSVICMAWFIYSGFFSNDIIWERTFWPPYWKITPHHLCLHALSPYLALYLLIALTSLACCIYLSGWLPPGIGALWGRHSAHYIYSCVPSSEHYAKLAHDK